MKLSLNLSPPIRDAPIVAIRSTGARAIDEMLAAWSYGATTWMCPLREPASKIDEMSAKLSAIKNWEFLHPEARTIINTSGSTGSPKFVVHRLEQHFLSAAGVNERMEFDATSSWLLSLPLYHVGGLAIVIRTLLAGAQIVMPREGQSLEEVVREQSITHISLVPTQLKRLLEHKDLEEKLKACKRIVIGGGPMPQWLRDVARERQLAIVASYGATEMASMWTAGSQGSGTVLTSRELSMSADHEVRVRGPMLFEQYYGEPAATSRDEDGFYCTGDLGRIDDQGNLHILGRRDNMFISGGENIHPEEIEIALQDHPSVQEAVVVGVPDAKWGERPIAFVRALGELHLEEEELRKHLRQTLPSFKIPDRFVEFPPSERESLKASRVKLRQKYGASSSS